MSATSQSRKRAGDISLGQVKYVIGNVGYRPMHAGIAIVHAAAGDHVGAVLLVDLNVYLVGCAESYDLHVVAKDAALSHLLQMPAEGGVNFLRRRRGGDEGARVGAGILPFRVAANPTSGLHVDKLLEVVGVVTHVLHDAGADLAVVGLIPSDLVRERVEQTVPWNGIAQLAKNDLVCE